MFSWIIYFWIFSIFIFIPATNSEISFWLQGLLLWQVSATGDPEFYYAVRYCKANLLLKNITKLSSIHTDKIGNFIICRIEKKDAARVWTVSCSTDLPENGHFCRVIGTRYDTNYLASLYHGIVCNKYYIFLSALIPAPIFAHGILCYSKELRFFTSHAIHYCPCNLYVTRFNEIVNLFH